MKALVWVLLLCAGAYGAEMEKLGRGIVAVRYNDTDVSVSWRLLATDAAATTFNIYRYTGDDGPAVRLNDSPISGATHFIDRAADLSQKAYYIVHPLLNGLETGENSFLYVPSNPPVRQYLSIPLAPPDGGTTPDGVAYTYVPNDASAADLDGDGEYEIVLKWEPTNSKDNSQSGHTGNVFLDAYKLDGTRLWRIDLGRNIRAGAHYTQFMVYDLDGDGRAELVCKTAPGSLDGDGVPIATRPERFTGDFPTVDPKADYRNSSGYILTGPEFFTIFDGLSGAELTTAGYLPARNNDPASPNVNAWGDNYGNRVDRFLAAVAYLDGERPSVILCRGYYTRAVLVAWNWRGGKLTKVWTFDSDDGTPGNSAYRGQGNHNLAVADVDGDGKDEIVYGAAAIDDDGRGLYATGRGHGDALHVGDFDPKRPGLEAFQPHETQSLYKFHGLDYKDARTGEPICGVETTGDIGRGIAVDIDPRFPGAEFWGSAPGLFNVSTCEADAEKGARARMVSARRPSPTNFAVWWDGDLLRELLDGTTISKWDWEAETARPILAPQGIASNNGTKATPALSADLFGDWREEVVWRSSDNRELRIYTTVIPTEHRMVTLMHDRQYRLAIAWQNVAYNQPPHPSFAPEDRKR